MTTVHGAHQRAGNPVESQQETCRKAQNKGHEEREDTKEHGAVTLLTKIINIDLYTGLQHDV